MTRRTSLLAMLLLAILAAIAALLIWTGVSAFEWISTSGERNGEAIQAWIGVQLMTIAAFVITCVGLFFGFINITMARDIERRAIESVREFNSKVRRSPGNLIANVFGFETKPQLEFEQGIEEVPEFDFDFKRDG